MGDRGEQLAKAPYESTAWKRFIFQGDLKVRENVRLWVLSGLVKAGWAITASKLQMHFLSLYFSRVFIYSTIWFVFLNGKVYFYIEISKEFLCHDERTYHWYQHKSNTFIQMCIYCTCICLVLIQQARPSHKMTCHHMCWLWKTHIKLQIYSSPPLHFVWPTKACKDNDILITRSFLKKCWRSAKATARLVLTSKLK